MEIKKEMKVKKVFWLEDQFKDFGAYKSKLFMGGYVVDTVSSVSEAVKKLRKQDYIAVIFDIKVLPGDDKKWLELDEKKLKENPDSDSYLGLELLRSLLNPEIANVKINPPIKIDPKKIIVLSVVFDRTEEITSLGIPGYQVLYKATSDPKHLLQMIKNMETRDEEKNEN
jgi:CheY-like chemotaxis protein